MMKSIFRKSFAFALLSAFIISGCGGDEINRLGERDRLIESGTQVNGYQISILEFDSCQYLISGRGYSQMMTHKGNCKYCIARRLN